MHPSADENANLEQIAKLLKDRKVENVTISAGHAVVTVSPRLQLLTVVLTGPGVLAEYRQSLQQDIVDAVNQAVREVVVASARTFEQLQEAPEIQTLRKALHRQIGLWRADDEKPADGAPE
ncbi:hypothetical protein AB0425_25785 [Actinosynnema sp. NPDC051121]